MPSKKTPKNAPKVIDMEVLPPAGTLAKTNTSSFLAATGAAAINHHWQAAQHHHRQSCAHLIMAGHALLDLKKQTKHGKWEALFDGFKGADEPVFDFSIRWGQRLMDMAKASKKHLPELQGLPFEQPMTEWEEGQLKTLSTAVSKKADGETLQQLAVEWGVGKKRQIPKPSTAITYIAGDDEDEPEEEEETATPAPLTKAQEKQQRIEEARHAFNGLIERWHKAVSLGQLDDLPQADLKGAAEFLKSQHDQVKTRIK
ncbi:hypothetical protein [Luteolibacter sp. LG18]|uniref:hypothetical protein n=1 Tax=Luteolibacter sp. LG18 TaxID=2819286 RepID=UPI002B2F7E96|nr:hypothetical protein llg_07280 [Luteolibacter sp. LG18]BCU79643.1 hypothetical protein llg_43580 [Luteolibacter sp. LG18]